MEDDSLAAVLLDMRDRGRRPSRRLPLYQRRQGRARTSRLPSANTDTQVQNHNRRHHRAAISASRRTCGRWWRRSAWARCRSSRCRRRRPRPAHGWSSGAPCSSVGSSGSSSAAFPACISDEDEQQRSNSGLMKMIPDSLMLSNCRDFCRNSCRHSC